MRSRKTPFEVHEHSYVSGPNANWSPGRKVVHSHADGHIPHEHPDTGPACYTIDKDEWAAATGLKGGSRKKYTPAPSGTQLPRVELEDWQREFDVIVVGPPAEPDGPQGPGLALPLRMVLGHGMTARVVRDA